MMCRSAAQKRYNRAVLLLSIAYAVMLIGAILFFQNSAPTGVVAFAAAILPALPILGIFWAMGRLLVEEQDEYLRSQLVRQSLIATAFALGVATVWGFLESFGLVPHVDAYYTAVLWFAGLGLGSLVNWILQPPIEEETA